MEFRQNDGIPSHGISKPYITPSGFAINGDNYTDNCLAKKLVPYIQNLPPNTRYIFWPDLAGAHYSKKAVQFLKDQNIKFLPKSENPPNTPEIRCIEDFWSLIKGEVYKDGWEAENLDQLEKRIKYCFKNFDKKLVHELAESTQRRIDQIRRYGLPENR